MRLASILAGTCLAGVATAVNMSRYDPQPGVEPAFKTYLRELYTFTEIKTANESFYDFFYPPGILRVVDGVFVGQEHIIEEKRVLLNPTNNHFWDHFPNKTSVTGETSTSKTYTVLGIINNIFEGPGCSCSASYYTSNFTLRKGKDGTLDFRPHARNLIFYNDFFVDPLKIPTSDPCAV